MEPPVILAHKDREKNKNVERLKIIPLPTFAVGKGKA